MFDRPNYVSLSSQDAPVLKKKTEDGDKMTNLIIWNGSPPASQTDVCVGPASTAETNRSAIRFSRSLMESDIN